MKCGSLNSLRNLFAGLVGACLVLSCTTTAPEQMEEQRHAPLIVARSGDVATLSWHTRVGVLYTILYADGRRVGVDWNPLDGAYRIPGNGQEIRAQDRMMPGVVRYYRLLIEPTASGSNRAARRR